MKYFIYTILFIVLIFSGFLLSTSKTTILVIRNFTVLSGSMEPSIKTGSLVFIIPKQTYKNGDVISFSQNGQLVVTHRIVKTITEGAEKQYITKGDANNTADKTLVPESAVIGKEIFAVPYIGSFSIFLKTLPGLIIFIILPALLFIIFEAFNIISELKKVRIKTNLI